MGQHRLAVETDPVSVILYGGRIMSLIFAKRYREALECARRALEIDANFYPIWLGMGLAQFHLGLTQEAVTSFQRVVELAPWLPVGAWVLAMAYHQAGDRERSQEWARKAAGQHAHTFGHDHLLRRHGRSGCDV